MMEKRIIRKICEITTVYKDIVADKLVELINRAKEDIIKQYPEAVNYNIKVCFKYDCMEEYDINKAILYLEYFREETDSEYNDRLDAENKKRNAELMRIYKEVDDNKNAIIEYLRSKGEI